MLDSNICIYMLDGNVPTLRQRIETQPAGALAVSSIAFAEVMVGMQREDLREKALRLFEVVPVLAFDHEAGAAYAQLPFRRARFDRLIAAHALALGLPLVTNNEADFAGIPGLKVENWTL